MAKELQITGYRPKENGSLLKATDTLQHKSRAAGAIGFPTTPTVLSSSRIRYVSENDNA